MHWSRSPVATTTRIEPPIVLLPIAGAQGVQDRHDHDGRFTVPDRALLGSVSRNGHVRRAAIDDIAALPVRMREAVAGLGDAQLDTPYREGGWTVRQVVHHVADSHLNAYVRVKLALTEDVPLVKPYDEQAWATLQDSLLPLAPSLAIIEGLHARWVALLRAMTPQQFGRTMRHPEYPEGSVALDRIVQMYAWHSRHHVAHVTTLRAVKGW